MELLHYIQREWARFKDAPLVFVALLILGITAGWSLASLYYQGRIADKDGLLARYRVALGIDKPSQGSLIELTNEEMRAKAMSTAAALRELTVSLRNQTDSAVAGAKDDKDKAEIVEMLKKAGAVPPPAVDAAVLQSYVGKYKDEAGLEVVITLTDGRLSALPTGQRPFALMAIDNNSFRPVAFEGIVITFKAEAGNTMGMELKRGTNTTQLKRVVETKQP